MTLMSTAENKRLAKAAKKAKQERQPPGQDEQIKAQMREALRAHGAAMSDDDREFAESVVNARWNLLASESSRAVLLLARFQNGHAKTNGHANGNGHLQVTNSAPAVAGDEVLPAETGATVPAGIARRNGAQRNGSHGRLSRENISHGRLSGEFMFELRDSLRANRPVPDDVAAAVEAGHEVELDCRRLQEHPDNRDSRDDDADIVKLAASIKELKQQQPILVRPTPAAARQVGGEKEFEVIFGERRWRACRVAGVKVRAKVRTDLTDAQVLELIGVENGLRKDLNPIERARHIEVLCRPLSELGGGKTLEEAAPIVGLKDPASASNCRRLLKLPKFFQDLVAAGELAESFARCLLKYCEAPRLIAAIEADYKKCHGPKGKEWERENWETRYELERHIENVIDDHVRPIDKKVEHRYSQDDVPGPKSEPWHYSGFYKRLFELTPEVEQQLDIVELEIDGKKQKVATNATAYDKLQIPLIKQLKDKGAKAKAAKAGRDEPAPKRVLSPAEKKASAKKQAEQLERRVEVWTHDWLKALICRELTDGAANHHWCLKERLLIAIAIGEIKMHWREGGRLGDAVSEAAKEANRNSSRPTRGSPYDLLCAIQDMDGIDDAGTAVVKAAISCPDGDPKFPTIQFDVMREIAGAAGLDLATEWKVMQEQHLDARLNGGEWAPRLEVFFELFQSGQLDALGEELKVHVAEAKGKEAKIQLFMTRDRILPLPKIIKPLPAAKAGKAKAAKKVGTRK